jgi:hypothetical protein
LSRALALCREHGIRSTLYEKMPLSVADLVLLRCASPQAEIGSLALLPVSHRLTIAGEFMGDLSVYRAPLQNQLPP